ncbi:MAG: protein kinase domain-containing protein [Myxococcota bacterium]
MDVLRLAGERYELQSVLGQGGMATVYRAWDTRLRVARAVKVLAPHLTAQRTIRRRFETEAHTMARLAHPNIVAVHDVGDDGKHVFIVMELLEGGSLMDFVETFGPLPPRTAAEVCCAVLRALAVAHAAGVVHRDIKPHNVLLAPEGTPKVTDFGIAHVQVDDSPGLTKTGSIMGTWAFMAPEQRAGARSLDARADLYAVGASLATLLTAELPGDLFVSELHGRLLARVPDELRAIVQRATRYDAADRHASAEELLADLERAAARLSPAPPDAPRLGHVYRAVRSETIAPASSERPAAGPSAEEEPSPRAAATFGGSVAEGPGTLTGEEAPPAVSPPPPAAHPTESRRPAAIAALLGGGLLAALLVAWATAEPPAVAEPFGARPVAEAPDPAPAAGTGLAPAAAPTTAAPTVAAPTPTAPPVANAPAAHPRDAQVAPAPRPAVTGAARASAATSAAPPDPAPAAPSAVPAPASASEPAPARFDHAGDASAAWLVQGSSRYEPGEVPPGTYRIEAEFDGAGVVPTGSVTLEPGERVTLRCDVAFQRCKRR